MESDAQELFMIFWFGYTLFMVGIMIGVAVWAKKNKQFKDQDHASKLPLEID
jgi:nitrogen fixation-related uncharacterized protein